MTPQTRADVRVILIMVLAVLAFMLFAGRYARAAEITCEHVRQAAAITGHTTPRAIARALGLTLTEAQLAEAARCLRRER